MYERAIFGAKEWKIRDMITYQWFRKNSNESSTNPDDKARNSTSSKPFDWGNNNTCNATSKSKDDVGYWFCNYVPHVLNPPALPFTV